MRTPLNRSRLAAAERLVDRGHILTDRQRDLLLSLPMGSQARRDAVALFRQLAETVRLYQGRLEVLQVETWESTQERMPDVYP